MKKFNALVGYTGFIGSNLKKKFKFNKFFNRKNITKIKNFNYRFIICSGTYSKIWLANKKPKQDLKNIKNLIKNLETVHTDFIVLISTIEVYGKNNNKNEKKNIYKYKNCNAYSVNRIILEKFIKKEFKNYLIIRLPIVYGNGFVKNCIFDLLNNNEIKKLNGEDLVQIYNVENLAEHIKIAIRKKLKVVNISPQPIKLSYIAKKNFNLKINNYKYPRKMKMKTIYKKFKISKEKTLSELKSFCERY